MCLHFIFVFTSIEYPAEALPWIPARARFKWTYYPSVCYKNIPKMKCSKAPDLHLVRLFWNQVLTCASVIFRALASAARSADARYFCRWKRFSSSQICSRLNDVRGFFLLGGVRFW